MLVYFLRKNNQVRNEIKYAKPLPSFYSIAVRNYTSRTPTTDINKDLGDRSGEEKTVKTNCKRECPRKM